MDSSNLLIPIAIIMMAVIFLWRLKGANARHGASHSGVKTTTTPTDAYTRVSIPDSVSLENTNEATSPTPMAIQEVPDELDSLELVEFQTFQEQYLAKEQPLDSRKPHPLLNSLSKNITDSQELIRLIKSDPELVARVINLANSAVFGLNKAITDINHAVIYLGTAQVKSMATQFAISQSFSFENERQQEAYDKIWKTSFLASTMALHVAGEAKLENASELSTRCLLNFLGDIALIASEPETAKFYLNQTSFSSRVKRLQNLLGCNPAVIGGVVAQKLEIPETLQQAIGLSYQPLMNQWSADTTSGDEKQNIIFCYSLCRLADYVMLEGDEEYAKSPGFHFDEINKPELYYLTSQLKDAGLEHLHTIIQNPGSKAKLAQINQELIAED